MKTMESEKAYMKVLILYFSATGNTAKIAKVIEEKLKEEGSGSPCLILLPLEKGKGRLISNLIKR